ncbi:RidA family protein [Actibacterium sp. 188UL27-1]|uniref:RidA family protein n=1 Tax=Actibacterium sp. 188UL27-1 TaxID=2786961 RepID=UPI00195DD6A1|nr:RidA family protein [Actibacterium sp. 188UL27-1]MBM7068238.1 RidA family protein [Actibacterium sp. 188UL27-1]
MVTGFASPDVWQSQGRGLQMGVVQPAGQMVHLTGQVAWDAQERIVGTGDIAAQTQRCFANIEALLQQVGGQLADIVSLTTYFTDRDQLPIIQAIRLRMFGQTQGPASTSVMVAGLGHLDFLVELTPVAVIPDTRFRMPG